MSLRRYNIRPVIVLGFIGCCFIVFNVVYKLEQEQKYELEQEEDIKPEVANNLQGKPKPKAEKEGKPMSDSSPKESKMQKVIILAYHRLEISCFI